jgi:hypothetical protein
MRVTLDIPDTKYKLLQSRAASEDTTVKAMLMRGLDLVLSNDKVLRRRRLRLPLLRSKHPESLEIDNERIDDLIGFP